MRKVELKDAPRGPLTVDRFGNPVQNIYVRKVERVDGKLQNSVIHIFPAVSQFWKYNPEEYLKLPAYSRDYPSCHLTTATTKDREIDMTYWLEKAEAENEQASIRAAPGSGAGRGRG